MAFKVDNNNNIIIELTPAELEFLKTCRFLELNASNENKITFLTKINDVAKLIQFAEKSPLVAKWCQDPQMSPFWEERWKLLSRFPSWLDAQQTGEIYRKLSPQPTISCFDLVRGMCFYNLANDAFATNEASILFFAFLDKAISYHNFAALQALTNLTLSSSGLTFTAKLNSLDSLLEKRLLKSAEIHGTPIFILCAFVCMEVAKLWQQQDDSKAEMAAYQNALQYLYAADHVQQQSQTAIHNAYYGLGLARSNQWQIDNIPKLINTLISITPLENDKTALMGAQQRGIEIGNKYFPNIMIAADETNFSLKI